MIEWIIFYDDGSSFSNLDGPPEDAPRAGVQVIVVTDQSCGCYTLAEQNYYCWQEGQWVPHDRDGFWQYMDRPGKEKVVLRGYWIDRERYAAMRVAALKDPRLPEVTAGPPRQPEGETVL